MVLWEGVALIWMMNSSCDVAQSSPGPRVCTERLLMGSGPGRWSLTGLLNLDVQIQGPEARSGTQGRAGHWLLIEQEK